MINDNNMILKLETINFTLDSTMDANLKPLALYVHVPFCKAKCTYCDFYSIIGREDSIPVYLKRIVEEIERSRETLDLSGHYIDTVFFGGGTPNLLPPAQLEKILDRVLKLTSPGNAMEIGMEINPGEASLENLISYKALGINRISIGMQSFQPHLLKFMSRIHTADKSISTYRDVREAGFENVSGDLIFAVPGQTRTDWNSDLKQLVDLQPEHISTYSLTVEAGTALHRWVDAGHIKMLEDTVDTGMYDWGRNFLEEQGYPNYEISNHAKPGFECRHNLNYWRGAEYLGFGPAAHSYFNKRRHWNIRNLDQYLEQVGETGRGGHAAEIIDLSMEKNEMILTRLRLAQGLNLVEYGERFKENLLESKQEVLQKWARSLSVIDNHLVIGPEGWALTDEISSDLMS